MLRCQHRVGSGRDFALPGAERHYAPDLGLEPVHLQVDLQIDLAGQSAWGTATTSVVSRRVGERKLVLDAVDLSDVEVSDPDGHTLTADYDGERIHLCWAEAPQVGERRRVQVRYRVEQPLTGMHFSWPDEAYPDRPRFLCTDHETERARYWLPCVDHPAVRTPLDLALRAGAEFTILANGVRVGEEQDHGDGTKTARWRLEYPCPSYLICLAIGDFVRAEGGTHTDQPGAGSPHADLEVAFFAPSHYAAADLERSFGDTKAMLDWMTEKLAAPFPFPKYYQVAVPGIGGAMENISLVTWDDAFVIDETLASEWARLVERINVHEMAHSYFGDAIVMRDFAHAWLKESWATYMESLWVEDTHGPEELLYQLDCEGEDYMQESDERYARPIVTREFNSSWDMYDQHLYPGGAWRIHMLRRRVGEEAFWAAVRDYVATYSGKLVETADFRRKLEDHSGLSLGKFFDQWLHSPGYPKLKVDFSHDAERGEARVVVEQTQASKKKNGASPIGTFDLDLEVDLETGEGTWRRVVVEVRQAKHTVVVPLAERPLQVVVDPESKLLKRLEFDPGQKSLRRSLEQGPLPARLHAARTLAKSGKPDGLARIEAAWAKEPFWGVRVAMAQALGKAGSQRAAEALANLLAVEEDPRVLPPLAEACGKYRDPGLAAALAAFIEKAPGYLARAAAYRSLGAQRGEEHLALLRAGAEDDSWWGWVRRGALQGLGATRSERARQLLLERVAYGREPLQVRMAAVQALADAASWQEKPLRKQTLEALVDLTRDPEYRMRTSTASAIGSLGESGGRAALEALTGRVATQDVPRIRRVINRLQRSAASGPEARKLRKQVEELEGKLRKLVQRVETLESRHKANGDGDGADGKQGE